jgi:hypothetical protein
MKCKEMEIVDRRCIHYFGEGICKKKRKCLPSGKDPERKDRWTFSRHKKLLECPRAFFFAYKLNLEPRYIPDHLLFGTLFHSLLASKLKGEEVEVPLDSRFLDPKLKKKQLEILLSGLELPDISFSSFQSEVSYWTSQFFGILDGVINEQLGFELKVASSTDDFPLWLEQIKFYFLISGLPRFLLFWVKQPGKKENFKPKSEWWFFSSEEFEMDAKDFLTTKDLAAYFSFLNSFPRNPISCPCEFKSLCEGGDISAEEFQIRRGGV